MLRRLEELPLTEEDQILFLGDYIDRGEDSCAVIETLLELRERRPNTIFLRGNHEQLLLDARDSAPPQMADTGGPIHISDELQLWLHNGGDETLISYKEEYTDEEYLRWWQLIPEAHWEFMRETRIQHESPRYLFVHAGVLPPGKMWEGTGHDMDERLWIREPFLSSRVDFGRIVVFGHTPLQRPLVDKNKIGIDTGAVFGGRLTAAGLDSNSRARRLPAPHILQEPAAG
jgi:serine/threonine protein phosphatase 1